MRCHAVFLILICGLVHPAGAQLLPDGHRITPTAAPGAWFQPLDPGLPGYRAVRAGQAAGATVSPDGKTLLVLTSGFNSYFDAHGAPDRAASTEHVFVYDIAGTHEAAPVLVQVLPIANSFAGLAFAPDGGRFFAAGGRDDLVQVFARARNRWRQDAAIPLGHTAGIGLKQRPLAGALAVSADGARLAICNTFNDSLSLIDLRTDTVSAEVDLRPYSTDPGQGRGRAGGETPVAVALLGQRAYVGSLRDREVVVLDLAGAAPRLVTRIPLPGNPTAIATSRTRLYVAQDNSDQVAIIDPATDHVTGTIDLAPSRAVPRLTGAGANGLTIAPDAGTLFVTEGGRNALAVIPLGGHGQAGAIPTGHTPQAVAISRDGRTVYVVNGASLAGPNPDHLSSATAKLHAAHRAHDDAAARAANSYVLQRSQAGLLAVRLPVAATLRRLTLMVGANNAASAADPAADALIMRGLRARIRHVIYIVKENRTFDQVLGDLANGADGRPDLAVFGRRVTPNFHQIAEYFVTLDRFEDAGGVSGEGWQWSTAARQTDFNARTVPLYYARRGAAYEAEGQNRGVDVGLPSLARLRSQPGYAAQAATLPGGAENLLPGPNDDVAPDGPDGARQTGYLWDSALRSGLTVRNYGFFLDLDSAPPASPSPARGHQVQAVAVNPTLAPYTDPYFRGFDNAYPDIWRYQEWKREFDGFVAGHSLPRLTLLRYMHDHMGNFATAAGGIDFPEAQQADNDYAVGLTLQAVAASPYARDTLIFVVEDDAQDGPDHVDAQRSTAYLAGPYVRHHMVDHTRYGTVDLIRTIEDCLGLPPLNLNDASARPMASVFDLAQRDWSFQATASPFLRNTAAAIPGTRFSDQAAALPVRPASWWASATRGFDWSAEDRVPAALFNRVIWAGFHPAPPPPPPAPRPDTPQ